MHYTMDKDSLNKYAINICQWNAQSLRQKKQDLELLLNREKVHICILSETWLQCDISVNFKDYDIYRSDRCDAFGGVAIIVHRSIKSCYNPIEIRNAGIELVSVKIFNCNNLEFVTSIYCSPSVQTSQCDWDQLFSKFPRKSIVAGDFNGHHSNWSCKQNSRGSQIHDASLDHNFIALNNGNHTRIKFVSNNLQTSSPDITFVTSDIVVYFKWETTNECLGSDHLIIKYALEFENQVNFLQNRNYKLANWKLYQNLLKSSFNHMLDFNNVQEIYDFFTNEINKAADKSIPVKKICTNPTQSFKPKTYWDPTLSRIIAERRLALKNFRRNPIPHNFDKLKLKIAQTQQLIRRAICTDRQRFYTQIDEVTDSPTMWKKMCWMKGVKPKFSQINETSKRDLLYSLTPDYVENLQPTLYSDNQILGQDFSMEELQYCLKRKDTSPGDDGITYSMIYNLPVEGKALLLRIYNMIFNLAHIPEQWRNIKIVPIPKHDSNSNTCTKLRPISLMSCICKIYHTMIKVRLEDFVEQKKIMSSSTVGFRKGQSSIDCLVRFISYLQIGMTKNIPTLACFLDIENAYNNVSIERLIVILDNLNVGTKICTYLWQFLNRRYLRIVNDYGEPIIRWTNRGLAQGDPISPLLFNIVTCQICTGVTDVNVLQYADDFVFYTRNKNIISSSIAIQNCLDTVVKNLKLIGLDVSSTKTKYSIFTRRRKVDNISLTIDDYNIEKVHCFKYLGIWIDKSLLWGRHINEIREKTMKTLNLFKILAGSSWGVHPIHLRRLYIALIRSRIDYGCFLFDTAAKTHLLKLDRVQNCALRIIGGFVKTTPIHVMECELNIPPLKFRRQFLASKYCLKSMITSGSKTITLLKELNHMCQLSYWKNKKKPLLADIYDKLQKKKVISCSLRNHFILNLSQSCIVAKVIFTDIEEFSGSKNSNMNTLLKYCTLKMLAFSYEGWYKLYTDGSKTINGLGAAFYDPSHNLKQKFKITSNVSIMSAELLAISEALSYVTNNVQSKKVVILSDSKSALQHLARCASGQRGVPIAYVIIRKILHFIGVGVSLRLQWIPAHIGLSGNEEVDSLAKEAISTGAETYVVPDFTEILNVSKLEILDNWSKHFSEVSKVKGIWYSTIQKEPPRVPWFTNCKMRREVIVMALRLRSGHIPLNKFKYLMKKSLTPNCSICGTVEDVHHILVECARSEVLRNTFVKKNNLNFRNVGEFHTILANPATIDANFLFNEMIKVCR